MEAFVIIVIFIVGIIISLPFLKTVVSWVFSMLASILQFIVGFILVVILGIIKTLLILVPIGSVIALVVFVNSDLPNKNGSVFIALIVVIISFIAHKKFYKPLKELLKEK